MKKGMFVFNETTLNIRSNFIPHEIIVVDDKGPPLVGKKTREKKNVHKNYRNSKTNNNKQLLRWLKFLQEHLHNETEVSKLTYYSRIIYKLNHIHKSSKAY